MPVPNADRYPFFDRLIFALLVLSIPAAISGSMRIFNDGDVSWHIAAGRWIIDNWRIPVVDPFSFTMSGKPWIAYEWASEVVYAAAFDLAGYAGLSAVVAAALIALSAVVFVHLRPQVGPIGLLLALTSLYLCIGPFMIARPHVLAWPLVAGWTMLMFGRGRKTSAPPMPAALLMFVWANLHGSFAIGFLILAAAALDAAIASSWQRRTLLRWAAFGMFSLIAALLNANGFGGFLHPLMVSSMKALPMIEEWMPSSPASSPLFFLVLAGVVGAILVRSTKLTVGETLLLLVLLAMALMHMRHQSILAIVGTMVVAPRLGRARSSDDIKDSRLTGTPSLVAAVAGAVLVVGVRLVVPVQPKENFANPWRMIASVPPDLREQPVLNEYSFGGPLIRSGVKPFIDGRADMYGDRFIADYLAIVNGDQRKFAQAVDRYGIRWAMLRNGSELAKALAASPNWERVYADDVGIIYRRI